MRNFQNKKVYEKLMTPGVVKLLTEIHEKKGKQELFVEAKPDILNAMLETAKIQSTSASNRIEGIFTSEKRFKELVIKQAEPKNRSEREIVGYREVLKPFMKIMNIFHRRST